MKALNKNKIVLTIFFSLFLISTYSNLNIFTSFHNLDKAELSNKINPTLTNDLARSFVDTINGKSYQMEYISPEKIEDIKDEIELREQEKDYNILINGHGTGLAPPTENDLDNLIGKKLIKNIVPEVHDRPPGANYDFSTDIYFPTVGNQGGQGSCAAWALTYYAYGYLEAKDYGWDASSGNSDYLMSPAWTFNKVSTSNYGSWMTTNAQIIVDWGCATMTTMPYDDTDFYSWGDEPAWREAPSYRAFDYYLMDFDEGDPDLTINAIKSFISSDTPVTFAFDANEYSAGFSDGNYILSSAEYDSLTYNHAQCIVGFNDTKSDDGDIGAFKVVNSWGTSFGDNGYYWLTYECLKEIGYAIGDFCLHLCVITDLIDYQPDLIATWEFNPAPIRMQDIITLGVGSHDTPLDYKIPWYEYDDVYVFPDFMALDISEFKPYYDLDNNTLFYLDIGASLSTGIISSFLIERYVGGVLEDITSESPDVPQTTPAYVYNTFMDLDHDLKVILETPINARISDTYTVNATVINNGIYDETNVNLYLYLDGIIVNSRSIGTLLAGDNETIEYIWTPIESKIYNFTAYSPPVSGEIFESNNIKINLVFCGMILFFDDFESGLSNWFEISGLWHLTNTSSAWPDPCYSPIHSMWFGSESTGNYDTGMREYGSLITIPIALPEADLINLGFYHWREGEGGSWDESFVYISTDGINWEEVYSTDQTIAPWEQYDVDITKYKGNSSVQIMFYFDTYDSVANDYRGWLIDDISIFAVGVPDHDLTVSIATPKYYEISNTYTVNATVLNGGLTDEFDVDLLLYLDNILVDSIDIPSLPTGTLVTINYPWTPTQYKTYNFTAYAPPVSGETHQLNNIKKRLITVHEIHLFDGLLINYTFTIFSEAYPSEFSYSHVSESLFHLDWDRYDDGYIDSMHWEVNAQTRIMEDSTGGFSFGSGFHTPMWIFSEVSIGNIIPIAVDAEGEHQFYIAGQTIYDVPDFGPVEAWVLEDLTLPGGIALYEKITGILLEGIFFYYSGIYNYTFEYIESNIEFPSNSLIVTTPNSVSSWETGTSHYIYWTSTGTISNVKIELYNNDIFLMEIISSTPDDGEYYWTVPSGLDDSTQYQIKIIDVSNPSTYDYSEYFFIYTISTITVATPDSSTSWETGTSHNLYWTSTGSISNVKIELFRDDVFVMEIVSSTPNDGEYYWTIPSELDESTQYQVKITDVSNLSIYDYSEYFEIKPPTIPGYNFLILIAITGICFIFVIKISIRKELKIK